MNFRVLSHADTQVVEAALWYEKESPGKGSLFLVQVEDAYRRILKNPLRFSRVEQPEIVGNVRWAMLRNFCFLVIFQILRD